MPFKPIKPFLTYSKQIEKLATEKNLVVSDTLAAQNALENISYYALIGGYKHVFYDPMTRKYVSGTAFDDILRLYYFDESLRELVFRYICHIERKMRSLISYNFSEVYSPNEKDYLNVTNYNNNGQNTSEINKLIKILSDEAHINTNHAYIIYQRNTYNNVPLWVIMNTLTFGQMSKMYSFLKSGIQSRISRSFYKVNEKELLQFLKVLTHFRNVCAHNERLYSFKCRLDIPDTSLHRKLVINRKGTQYVNGKSDLFSIVIAFRYLLPQNEFISFKRQISRLIDKIIKDSAVLTESKLLSSMGFPLNWKNITRYKL